MVKSNHHTGIKRPFTVLLATGCTMLLIGGSLLIFRMPITESAKNTKRVVNARNDITLSSDFVDNSARLSYTVSIMPTVKTIRTENLVFERGKIDTYSRTTGILFNCKRYTYLH